MPQQQSNVTLASPGFAGLNTEDSPLSMDPSFAAAANNCTIDKLGRLSSRKGFTYITSNPSLLENGTGVAQPIVSMGEFIKEDTGTPTLFVTGNNKIFIQETDGSFALIEQTLPTTPTADDWQMAQLNDKMYFVQAGHVPLVYTPGGSPEFTVVDLHAAGAIPSADGYPNCVHSAFGRLWYGDFDNNSTVVAWSSILNGRIWNSGGSGNLQTSEYWPSGFGKVTALAAHNNFMLFFGTNNILVYTTTSDVINSLRLSDTIEGIGCISRDTVVATGEDFMFCDASGIRSLNRTLQDSTIPLGDISANIRTEIQGAIRNENANNLKAVFHNEDSFYCCFFPTTSVAYVFDTWQPLQTGAFRATSWDSLKVRCGLRTRNRTTYFAGDLGVYIYIEGVDISYSASGPVTTPVAMNYASYPLNFGSSVNALFPKQIDITLFGGTAGKVRLNWNFNFGNTTANAIEKPINLNAVFTHWTATNDAAPPINNAAQWTSLDNVENGVLGFWSDTSNSLSELKFNVWGSGRNLAIGFSTDILGPQVSIQEINIQALQGRIL
tara:strand:+ start:40 stop:1692 length:1653 start_codon:yes stop_codon:yes gene_type:complete